MPDNPYPQRRIARLGGRSVLITNPQWVAWNEGHEAAIPVDAPPIPQAWFSANAGWFGVPPEDTDALLAGWRDASEGRSGSDGEDRPDE